MKRYAITQILIVVSSLSIMGIAGYAEDKPIKKDLKITGIPKNINNPYMVIQFGGAMEACKEIGAEGKVVGP